MGCIADSLSLKRSHRAISKIRLVHLRHTASTEDEVVLTFRQGMQADVEAEPFRVRPEFDWLRRRASRGRRSRP